MRFHPHVIMCASTPNSLLSVCVCVCSLEVEKSMLQHENGMLEVHQFRSPSEYLRPLSPSLSLSLAASSFHPCRRLDARQMHRQPKHILHSSERERDGTSLCAQSFHGLLEATPIRATRFGFLVTSAKSADHSNCTPGTIAPSFAV